MKKAFTMAELMITMAIIGVISSLMMLQIAKARPNENALLYRKAFFATTEAVSAMVTTPGLFDSELVFRQAGIDLELLEEEETDSEEVRKDKIDENNRKKGQYFCEQMLDQMNTTGGTSCATTSKLEDIKATKATGHNFMLTNGIRFGSLNQAFSNDNGFNPGYIDICVDINGLKGPNYGCSSNQEENKKDQYRIRITYNGKVTTAKNWGLENKYLSEALSKN